MSANTLPSYLVAADNHDIANDGWGMEDWAKFAAGGIAGAAVGQAAIPIPIIGLAIGAAIGAESARSNGAFAAASLMSGFAAFYNTAMEIGEVFGADTEQMRVEDKLAELDSDFSEYYKDNQTLSELTGMLVGSVAPTMLSLRAYRGATAMLQAAQRGKTGTNMGQGTGLLMPTREKYLKAAIRDMGPDNAFELTNANYIKAFVAGAGEETIQGAIASGAVLATMHGSPIFNQMDAEDIFWNVTSGAFLGGAIGGAIRGVQAGTEIRTGVEKIQQAIRGQVWIKENPEAASAMEEVLTLNANRIRVKQSELDPENIDLAKRKLNESMRRHHDRMNENSNKLANEDADIGNLFSNNLIFVDDADAAAAQFMHGTRIGRSSVKFKHEVHIEQLKEYKARLEPDIYKAVEGHFQAAKTRNFESLDDAFKFDDDFVKHLYTERGMKHQTTKAILQRMRDTDGVSISYFENYGHNAGRTFDEVPDYFNLADRAGHKGALKTVYNGLKVNGQLKFKFKWDERWNFSKASFDEIEARYYWAFEQVKFATTKHNPYVEVLAGDLPMLTAAYLKHSYSKVKVVSDTGEQTFKTSEELLDFIKQAKGKAAVDLLQRKKADVVGEALDELEAKDDLAVTLSANRLTNNKIAQLIDVRPGALEGSAVSSDELSDLFAFHSYAKEYTKKLNDSGRNYSPSKLEPVYLRPRFTKVQYDASRLPDANEVRGMASVYERQKMYQKDVDLALNEYDPGFASRLVDATDDYSYNANSLSGNQGKVTSADADYGELGMYTNDIGRGTSSQRLIERAKTETAMNSSLVGVMQTPEAAVELSGVFTWIRGSGRHYYIIDDALVPRSLALAIKSGKVKDAQKAIDEAIESREALKIERGETLAALNAHVKRNGEKLVARARFDNANGYANTKDPLVVYPPPRNPNDYPYFAFVIDPKIGGQGHVSMVYAATKSDLSQLIADVKRRAPEFDVTAANHELKLITKGEAERYHKAMGDYHRDDTISERYIDSTLRMRGVSADYVPPTDPEKIVRDLIDWHYKQDDNLVRYAVSSKYAKLFKELKTLAESHSQESLSKYGSSFVKYAEEKTGSNYANYIKTALDITNLQEMPMWTAFNNIVDSSFSIAWNGVKEAWTTAIRGGKNIDEAVEQVNDIFDRMGVRTAYYDTAMYILANRGNPSGHLQTFVNRANALTATLMLRMDPTNAYNNAIGSTILTSTEIRSIVKQIKNLDPKAAEAFMIKVPGTDDFILSPQKMYATAIKNAIQGNNKEWYSANGFLRRHLAEYQSITDDLAVRLDESAKVLDTRWKRVLNRLMKIGDFGEKWTGNTLAEEFNRFVSADIMKQITDVAVKQNLITPKEALAYINTFVNRTQGNYLASQRPLLFSGAVGQSIGLFQTYQFNLIQQLMRHVSAGTATKDAAFLIGMQGTVYGMNGLPAFNLINQHIVGQAAGNRDHHDLYSATYSAFDKDAADWLMYGFGSNVFGLLHPDLKTNVYVRGDVNPRHATIVPTRIADVPFVGVSSKFFASMKETVSKWANGGDVWSTFLQGVEHAGINRPLMGIAQSLQAFGNEDFQSYATTNSGNLIVANDFVSLTNLMRIVGARPMTEAITTQALFRQKAYDSYDAAKRRALSETIRTTMLAGNVPDQDQIDGFLADYVATGGDQTNFNRWIMKLYKDANTSQANAVADNLSKPAGQNMQRLLGGARLQDGFYQREEPES